MTKRLAKRVAGIAAGCVAGLATAAASAQVAPDTVPPVLRPDPQPAAQPAAQADARPDRRTYDAAYFARYAPATALEIVSRVPGFSIEDVDPAVRGFAQAAGNVVINGQRPSSKSDTLQVVLSRIPASRVLRVEVAAGDRFGAEFTGKSQVLNLVTTTAGGLATTIEAGVTRDFTGKLFPEGSASTQLRRGASTFSLSATIDNDTTSEEGFDRIVALPAGVQTEFRRKTNVIADPNATVAASWEHSGGPNRTAHLNARVAIDRFSLTQYNQVTPAVGALRDDRLFQRYRTDTYELGGDVTRPLAGGGLKLIGLATRRYGDSRDSSFLRVGEATIGGFTQRSDALLAETLARLAWTRSAGGWTIETGAEGVVNQLDSKVDLFALSADGEPSRIDLPVDDATVREVRGEAFVTVGRALSPTLRTDLGLTYEASRLTVSGDAAAARTLQFLKPSIALDWRPSPKWRAQLSLKRTVAQLQFEDFISSAELSNDRVNGGNPDLLPQRAWEALATLEHPILGDGVIRIEAGYNRIALVQDRVPTPEGFDAPGNLGDGRVVILKTRVEAPLTTLGIKGGRLILYGSLVDTAVRDPYTLRDRRFSGNSLFYGEASFRQDLGKFAWGWALEAGTPTTFYRLDETDENRGLLPFASLFAEWRPNARTILTAGVDNLFGLSANRERTFYTPDRRTPDPFLRESRQRNSHLIPSITFKRTFG